VVGNGGQETKLARARTPVILFLHQQVLRSWAALSRRRDMLDFCDLIFRTSKKVMIVLAYRSVVDYCSPKTCAAQPTKYEELPSVNQHTKLVHHPLDAVMTQFVDEPKIS